MTMPKQIKMVRLIKCVLNTTLAAINDWRRDTKNYWNSVIYGVAFSLQTY